MVHATVKKMTTTTKMVTKTYHEPTDALEHLVKGVCLMEQTEMTVKLEKWAPHAFLRLLDPKKRQKTVKIVKRI